LLSLIRANPSCSNAFKGNQNEEFFHGEVAARLLKERRLRCGGGRLHSGVVDVENLYRQIESWDPNLRFDAPPLQEVEANLKVLPRMGKFKHNGFGVDLAYCMLGPAMKEGSLITDPEECEKPCNCWQAMANTGVAIIVTSLSTCLQRCLWA
jgi:hypothetical protein